MGLSIHFKGCFKVNASLSGMVEEVKDIAEIYKWKYTIFETDFPGEDRRGKKITNSLYGICFTPPGCETVSLTFLSNRKLVSYWSWVTYIKSQAHDESTLHAGESVKTQYAGAIVHKLIIHLLDYLSKKYFQSFEMTDEGQYWETRDGKLLDKNFSILNVLLGKLQTVLDENPRVDEEIFENYFQRLFDRISSSGFRQKKQRRSKK
jgi:hypothetical protein